jgi:hypothetical protein
MSWTEIAMVVGAAAAVAGAVFTAASAFGSLLAARATKRAAEAQILLDLLNDYAAPDMTDALRILIVWHGQHKEPFTAAAQWKRDLKAGDPGAQDVDRARRRVTSYFYNADQLREARLISKAILRRAADKSGLAVLVLVLPALERQIDARVDLRFIERLAKLCPHQTWLLTEIPASRAEKQ